MGQFDCLDVLAGFDDASAVVDWRSVAASSNEQLRPDWIVPS